MIKYFLLGLLLLSITKVEAQQPPVDPQVGQAEAFDKFFWRAQAFKNTQRYEQALKAFKSCDSLQADKAVILSEISMLSYQLNRPSDALDYAERSLKAEDVRDWHFKQAADIHQELKLFKRAAEILQELHERKPESPDPLYRLVGLYIQTQSYDKALESLDDLQALKGVEPDINLQKKQIYLELGELDKAVGELDVLIDAFPADFNYQLEKAEVLAANDRYDDARDIWLAIVKEYSVQSVANLRLARYYQDQGDYEKSYSYLKVAMGSEELDIDDKVAVLINMYSLSAEDSSLTAKAYELVDLTISSAPLDPRSWSVKGDFLLRDGRLEEAHEAFAKAVELPGGTKYEIWQQMLVINAELGNWDRLQQEGEKTIELFPAQSFPYLLAGLAYLQDSSPEKAVEWLEGGLDLTYGNKALQGQFYSYIAQAYHQLEKHKESDDAFESALRIDPNNASNLNNYAFYLSERNEKLEKALSMTQKSNQISRDNPVFLDTWAWVLFRLERYDEALEIQEKAISLMNTPESELLEHLGDILFYLQRVDEAIQKWQEALSLGSEHPEKLQLKIDKRSYHE